MSKKDALGSEGMSASQKEKREVGEPLKVVSVDEIWPQERDFMARPERYRYVRKLVKPKGCVFCSALKGKPDPENLVLFKGKTASVILNKYPYNSGHLLVVPNQHCGDMDQLSSEAFLTVSHLLHEVLKVVKKAYHCEGINVGLNLGAVAGAGIPDHLHWHVIPRWFGDTNFFPIIAETKALPETNEQAYARYEEFFKELSGEF